MPKESLPSSTGQHPHTSSSTSSASGCPAHKEKQYGSKESNQEGVGQESCCQKVPRQEGRISSSSCSPTRWSSRQEGCCQYDSSQSGDRSSKREGVLKEQ